MYDEIVSALSSQGDKTEIKQREIEDNLCMKLGATQQTTLNRHLEIMIRLGYLKKVQGGTAYLTAEYDLVGAKVREIALRAEAREKKDIKRRGRPRL